MGVGRGGGISAWVRTGSEEQLGICHPPYPLTQGSLQLFVADSLSCNLYPMPLGIRFGELAWIGKRTDHSTTGTLSRGWGGGKRGWTERIETETEGLD